MQYATQRIVSFLPQRPAGARSCICICCMMPGMTRMYTYICAISYQSFDWTRWLQALIFCAFFLRNLSSIPCYKSSIQGLFWEPILNCSKSGAHEIEVIKSQELKIKMCERVACHSDITQPNTKDNGILLDTVSIRLQESRRKIILERRDIARSS